jgi:transcriptional regulator with XRE-family HTH domain
MRGRGRNFESARDRVARHMRALRADQGISQEALAAKVDLHRTYIGSIERSERNASLDNIERIAHALGVDICDLLSPA